MGDWPRDVFPEVDWTLQRPVVEVAPKARIQWVMRRTGSRSLPYPGSSASVAERASVSVRMAVTTAAISPRTPDPLLLKTSATLWT
jgi:hypothetical protein